MIKIYLTAILVSVCLLSKAQVADNSIKIIGAMKNVMWKGDLKGRIFLDTISNKKNLYGLGPTEDLNGELLILDGQSYVSYVTSDVEMKVEESYQLKAPFFAYANVSKWSEQNLPNYIESISQLEAYLDSITKTMNRPYFFKLSGTIDQSKIHVVNLPKGTKVKSPEDAHKGQQNYNLKNKAVDILGFFSIEHQSIFTHHDTYLHMHLITSDKKMMGHLDDIKFKKISY